MHAIVHRPETIEEGKALNTDKKELKEGDSDDDIINTESSKKAKSLSDIAYASKFVGQMSMTRDPDSGEVGEGGPKK